MTHTHTQTHIILFVSVVGWLARTPFIYARLHSARVHACACARVANVIASDFPHAPHIMCTDNHSAVRPDDDRVDAGTGAGATRSLSGPVN